MRQLTKELKSVFTTWYNVENNEYWINYWYLTHSDKYVCMIYDDYDNLICKIKYKRHWNYPNIIEEKNIRERHTQDKKLKNLIKRAWQKYA